jgi:hypothetical protein
MHQISSFSHEGGCEINDIQLLVMVELSKNETLDNKNIPSGGI